MGIAVSTLLPSPVLFLPLDVPSHVSPFPGTDCICQAHKARLHCSLTFHVLDLLGGSSLYSLIYLISAFTRSLSSGLIRT